MSSLKFTFWMFFYLFIYLFFIPHPKILTHIQFQAFNSLRITIIKKKVYVQGPNKVTEQLKIDFSKNV